MLIIAVTTPAIISNHFSLFEHAANNKTATISAIPAAATYQIGQTFVVNIVIDGGGQAFNAAQASVAVSSNLTVQSLSINPPSSSGCNFTFVNTKNTPSIADPSFAGAILNGSSTSCILYSLTLQANTAGVGTVTLTKGSVKAYINNGEIILSTQNGTYPIGSTVTPTPVPNTPTPTPIIPTSTPTPTPLPPSPTPIILPVQPPSFDSQPTDTYSSTVLLSGTNASGLRVYINNSTTGVTYPTTTSWQLNTTLIPGINTFNAFAQNNLTVNSTSVSITINLHKTADINGDGIVDLTDLSMFATDWENTGALNYSLSDMNGDGIIDLTDFSILAKAYGN